MNVLLIFIVFIQILQIIYGKHYEKSNKVLINRDLKRKGILFNTYVNNNRQINSDGLPHMKPQLKTSLGYTVFPLVGFYSNISDNALYSRNLAQDPQIEHKVRVKKVLIDSPNLPSLRKKRSVENISTGKGKSGIKAGHHSRKHKRKRSKSYGAFKPKTASEKHKRPRKHILRNENKPNADSKKSRKNVKHRRHHKEHNDHKATNVKDTISRRLIAAQDAKIDDHPYVVSIQKRGEHWCTGALLNPRLVVTTANCVWMSRRVSRLKVRAGSRHTDHGGQLVGIQEVVKHPAWSIRTEPDNDIALLLLDERIKFSDKVHAVDLPNRNMIPSFDDAWIASWGAERRDGVYNKKDATLQVYYARIMDRKTCNNITQRFGVTVTDNFICFSQNGRRAPCTRDTGAPAVSDGVLWGIASWGIRRLCGTARFPAMFSYLGSPANMDFLTKTMKYLMADVRQDPFIDRYPN
ncbi:hypothetical protein ACJJTC_015921 [Scirpophaga incertulas]